MSDRLTNPVTAFDGHYLFLSGPLVEVALAVKTASENSELKSFLVFDDATGRVVDLDLRGTKSDIIERLSLPVQKPVLRRQSSAGDDLQVTNAEAAEPRGRGRPKLGVVSREVTLLPRQWEWLNAQSGGASAVIRRLVDEAKRNSAAPQKKRVAQESAYQFMVAIAGDFPDYEEATRGLFADDRSKLESCIAAWPADIQAYIMRIAYPLQDA